MPIGLTLLQPDLSTTMLLAVLAGSMLVIGRVPARFLLPLVAAAAVSAPLADRSAAAVPGRAARQLPGRRARVPDRLGLGRAAGAASRWARGRCSAGPTTRCALLRAQYLPERETDLALASLVGQWGLVAGAGAVLAAIILVWRLALASRAPRTPHGALVGGGLAILLGVETVVSVGGNLGLLPLAGVPFPLLSYGGTALVVHLAAIGVVLAVRRDGARRRLWALPRLAQPAAAAGPADRARRCRRCWCPSGSTDGGCRATQGEALSLAGQEQMTRCFRLPAPRGSITDRHDAPLAVNAVDVGSGVDQVLVVPALLRARPADVDRLADAGRAPARGPARADRVGAQAPTLSLPVADVPRGIGDAVTAAGIAGVFVVPEPRRAYPTGALLGPVLGFAGVATPDGRGALARTCRRARSSAAPASSSSTTRCCAGSTGSSASTSTRGACRWRSGERQDPVPGADLRLSIDLGLQRQLDASLAAAVRAQPRPRGRIGAAVAMDPRSGQVLAIASTPSFDNNVYGPPVDAGALRALAGAPGSPMLEHVTQAVAPPGSTFKLVVAAANQAHPVFAPAAGRPHRGRLHLRRPHLRQLEADGADEPGAVDRHVQRRLLLQARRGAGAGGDDRHRPGARGGPADRHRPARPSPPATSARPDSVRANGGTWYGGSTVILGIGQGYLQVTPLQNARWTAAVATGNLVTPRLGLAVGTGAGHVHRPAARRPRHRCRSPPRWGRSARGCGRP